MVLWPETWANLGFRRPKHLCFSNNTYFAWPPPWQHGILTYTLKFFLGFYLGNVLSSILSSPKKNPHGISPTLVIAERSLVRSPSVRVYLFYILYIYINIYTYIYISSAPFCSLSSINFNILSGSPPCIDCGILDGMCSDVLPGIPCDFYFVE